MSRRITLLSPEITELLVKQLGHELQNYNIYMTFAAYFGREGYSQLEEYYRKRADEEHKHHKWIVDYMIDADCDFSYPTIGEVSSFKPTNLAEPFDKTVVREIETTQLIYEIYKLATTQSDYMTIQWLQEYLIKEQIEEENTSRMAQSIAEQDDTSWIPKAESILELLD